jgi:hypothetical protein
MKVTRENDKILITMNSSNEAIRLMKMFDYAKYVELTEGMNQVSDEEIELLSEEVNNAWIKKRTGLQ